MNKAEFKDTLAQVQLELSLIAAWRVAYAAIQPNDANVGFLNRYKAYLVPAKIALRDSMMSAAARIVDKDERTASIPNLVNAVRINPEFLGADHDAIERLERGLQGLGDVRSRLIKFRNKRLAHYDREVDSLQSILFPEFEKFMNDLESIANDFSSAFDRSVTSRQSIRDDSERHLTQLFDDARRGHKLYLDEQEKSLEDELRRRTRGAD